MVVMERRYECPAAAGCEGDAQARQITIRTLLSRGTRARAWLRSTSTRAAGVGQRFSRTGAGDAILYHGPEAEHRAIGRLRRSQRIVDAAVMGSVLAPTCPAPRPSSVVLPVPDVAVLRWGNHPGIWLPLLQHLGADEDRCLDQRREVQGVAGSRVDRLHPGRAFHLDGGDVGFLHHAIDLDLPDAPAKGLH
jgi:hypothetical protein